MASVTGVGYTLGAWLADMLALQDMQVAQLWKDHAWGRQGLYQPRKPGLGVFAVWLVSGGAAGLALLG